MAKKQVHPIDEKAVQHGSPPGPIPNRKCRDVLCLLLFVLFWVGMFVIAGFSLKYGDINRLKYGSDSEGNLCGVQNSGFNGAIDATKLPNLLYAKPWISNGPRICVASCPTVTAPDTNAYKEITCEYGVSFSATSNTDAANQLTASNPPACYWGLKSQTILNRCIPVQLLVMAASGSSSTTDQPDAASSDLNARAVANQIWGDIIATWRIILIGCGIAIILSFVWLVVIRWFGAFVVYTTILLATIGTWTATAYFWYSYYCSINMVPAQLRLYSGNSRIDSAIYNQQTLLGLAIIMSAVTFFLTLFVIAARKRIRLAINVIGEASKALRSMPTLLFVPFMKNVVLSMVFAWCLWILLLLASSGTNIASNVNAAQSSQTGQTFEPNKVLQFLQIYYVFGLFWSYWLLLAILQCTIAGAIGGWYWTLNKSGSKNLNASRLPVLSSFGRAIRYHLGSLAFGSLLLAILSLVRLVLAYMSQQANKAPANKLLKAFLCCVQCCLACFEKFLKFLNTNAYIEVAVYGTAFFPSAKRAFELIWRNAFRVAVITQVSGLILFLGKIMVVALTILATLGMTQSTAFIDGVGQSIDGRFWSVTLIVVAILSWMIASSFTAVLQMTIDTIFLCFCEDSEKNDGSAEKPFYMPPSLRALVDGNSVSAKGPSKIVIHQNEQSSAAAVTQSKAYY